MYSPRFGGQTASSRSTARAILLAVALLLAQWVGMLHRIDHASGQIEPQAQSHGEGGYSNSSSVSHSCVVFDGVCLADLLPTTVVALVAARAVHVLQPASDFASWSGRFAGHFQPRAPPAA
jgi:flagellar biosynthesis protein FlhB